MKTTFCFEFKDGEEEEIKDFINKYNSDFELFLYDLDNFFRDIRKYDSLNGKQLEGSELEVAEKIADQYYELKEKYRLEVF
jgi:hypothetical protein